MDFQKINAERFKAQLNKKAGGPGKSNQLFIPAKKDTDFLAKGYTNIPNAIIHDPGLSSQDLRVLLTLNHHSMEKYECYPSLDCIALGARCSQRSVVRSLKKLKDLKYIEWKRTQRSNSYVILRKAKKV